MDAALSIFFQQVVGPPKFKNLEEERDYLRRELERAQKDLERVGTKPTANAVVIHADGDRLTVRAGNQVVNIPAPQGEHGIRSGSLIEVAVEGCAAIRSFKGMYGTGAVMTVKRVHPERNAYELEGPGMPGTVSVFSAIDGVRVGDRVLTDESHCTILTNLGKAPSEMAFAEETGVAWDDVGGQAEAKRALREAIEEPFTHAATYKKFGQSPSKGILLWGPPGNGKTMLGKAAASAVSKLHGASGKSGGFIYVKGPEVLNMFVGASEAGVRRIFQAARAHKEAHGYPAVVFIDEADALVGKRGAGLHEGMERTIVPQFLAEMDGLEESGAFVLLATNRPDAIDAAVLRPGRVDRKVEVGPPSKDDFADIIRRALGGKPVVDKVTPEYLAQLAAEDAFTSCPLFKLMSKSKEPFTVHLGSFASGAMAVGVVAQATQEALRRHLAGPSEGDGISSDDVLAAVKQAAGETRVVDPGRVLAPMAQMMGKDFAGVEAWTE
jgi:proteasome-associated ATPase